jgi:DNA mismatch endonuclease, patch repair protein
MADRYTREKRSAVMRAVKGTGNRSTELRLAALMKSAGIKGWRRGSTLVGRPDFVFPSSRLAIFVDGCFWHGCPKHSTVPATNRLYWIKKIDQNIARDREVRSSLRRKGWKVLRIWEHQLRVKDAIRTTARIRRALNLRTP